MVTSSPIWPKRPTRSSRMTFILVLLAVPPVWRLEALDHPAPQRPLHRHPGEGRGPVCAPRWIPARRNDVEREERSGLRNRVGHDPDEARALDGAGELALLQRRDGGDARGNDLAAFRHVALQQPDVLVVDLGRVRARERAGLAAALEGPAALGGSKFFDSHGSLSLSLEAARGTAVAVETAAVAVATRAARAVAVAIVAVALLHHGRRAFLELVDANGHETQHVFVDALLALHLGDSRRRRVDVA